ncbi:MAG: TlpA family protein disulfide reductase [Actinomycetota bacterium]
MPRRLACLATALAVVFAACSNGSSGNATGNTGPAADDQELVAAPASFDLAVGPPSRFLVGLFSQDRGNVGYGSVELSFSFLGEGQARDEPRPGPKATARFLPIPGSPEATGARPTFLRASEGRGVYAAQVGFDEAGFWEVRLAADLAGAGQRTATASFEVLPRHRVPAPGEPAIASRNLTVDTPDARPQAIDSRATDTEPVPDPEPHRTTIADALAAGRPAVVVFATPTFCVSRFCGPVTDMVADLADDYADRASFIHIEIWADFEARRLNDAAAEWLTRDGADGNEPWVFLIGADGRIAARWDNVATRGEIEALLRDLPLIGAGA